MKDFSVYALVVGKTGLKMKASPPDPPADPAGDRKTFDVTASAFPTGTTINYGNGMYMTFGDNAFEGRKLSASATADTLARFVDRPVVDMTELKENYDFTLQFTPEDFRAMMMRSAVVAGITLPLRGGNMDYNQLVEGTTVYLPVYHPGALLFVGDGHAAQGDGELTGDALETSTDWTFTVDVLRNRNIASPRLENAEYCMASGISNSLPEALQSATTNLSTWLQEEYKLNPAEIGVVLGTGMRYEVAEVVDPQVHIVAKIAKSLLEPIPK